MCSDSKVEKPMFSIRRFFSAIVIAFTFLSVSATQAAESKPSAVIEAFQAQLLEVMKGARRMDVAERYKKLLPAVDTAFNLRLMIRIAIGNYWQTATPEQRDAVSDAFKRMNIATVATLFDGYSGQVFETVGESDGPQKTTLVETRLVNPDKTSVKLVYRTLLREGRWQIIDVIVDDGISEVQVRQSEYATTLAEGGIGRLTEMLKSKANQLLMDN